MVVAWDEDWSDLFLLHLASPDPVVRHDATLALTVAVMVARDAGPAPALLEEAIRREKFPKLKETMREAAERGAGRHRRRGRALARRRSLRVSPARPGGRG